MKLDDDLRLEILEKIGIYCNRFSIPEPKVMLTTKEVLDMPKKMISVSINNQIAQYNVSNMYDKVN